MNDFKTRNKFLSDKGLNENEKQLINDFFIHKEGIISIEILNNEICVEYYKHLHNLSSIIKDLKNLEINIIVEKRELNPFKRFIKNLGASNKANFGNSSLDCCGFKKNGNQ